MTGFRIVLVNGCFDHLHFGHVLHLRAAHRLVDRGQLIVAVTKDRSVNKGPGRPFFTQEQRESMLRELRCVSGTMLVDDPLEALDTLRPDVWALGAEYRGRVQPAHEAFCLKHRIDIAFTDEQVWSSTQLLKCGAHQTA